MAGQLARAGALRAVFPRGAVGGIPREVRLGPAEVEPAYTAARRLGFRPRQEFLGRLSAHAGRLSRDGGLPAWMVALLMHVERSAAVADLSPLGIGQRLRIKDEIRDVEDALTAASALARGVDDWERYVSARLFDDSKRLGEIRSRVVTLLRNADPRWVAPRWTTQARFWKRMEFAAALRPCYAPVPAPLTSTGTRTIWRISSRPLPCHVLGFPRWGMGCVVTG